MNDEHNYDYTEDEGIDYTDDIDDADGVEDIDLWGVDNEYIDLDGDGIDDMLVSQYDTDGDGIFDTAVIETDLNNDNVIDSVTYMQDTDFDGEFDAMSIEIDADFDGDADYTETHNVVYNDDGSAVNYYAITEDADFDGIIDNTETGFHKMSADELNLFETDTETEVAPEFEAEYVEPEYEPEDIIPEDTAPSYVDVEPVFNMPDYSETEDTEPDADVDPEHEPETEPVFETEADDESDDEYDIHYDDSADIDTDDDDSNTNVQEIDTDGDGDIDVVITTTDTDGDGIADIHTYARDLNGDGKVDFSFTRVDTDGDGDFDSFEAKIFAPDGNEFFFRAADLDGDGMVDDFKSGKNTPVEELPENEPEENEDDNDENDSDTTPENVLPENDETEPEAEPEVEPDEDTEANPETEPDDDPTEDSENEFVLPYIDYDTDNNNGTQAFDLTNFDAEDADEDGVIGEPEDAIDEWEFQGSTNRCAIYSQKFVIDEFTGEDTDIEELADIAEENGWFSEGSGTPIAYMDKLLDYYNVPNETSYDNSMEDLVESLNDGHRVIVAVDADEYWYGENDSDVYTPGDGVNHAIEVIGIDNTDPDNPMVIVNDSGTPNGQGLEIPMETFMDAWEDGNNYMVECM